MAGLLIGDMASRTGLSAPTIRYYESIGLLPKVSRSATGYRRYTEATVAEPRFIKRIQQLARFQAQIAGEIDKWDERRQPICKGLYQIIEDAEDATADAMPADLRPRNQRG